MDVGRKWHSLDRPARGMGREDRSGGYRRDDGDQRGSAPGTVRALRDLASRPGPPDGASAPLLERQQVRTGGVAVCAVRPQARCRGEG